MVEPEPVRGGEDGGCRAALVRHPGGGVDQQHALADAIQSLQGLMPNGLGGGEAAAHLHGTEQMRLQRRQRIHGVAVEAAGLRGAGDGHHPVSRRPWRHVRLKIVIHPRRAQPVLVEPGAPKLGIVGVEDVVDDPARRQAARHAGVERHHVGTRGQRSVAALERGLDPHERQLAQGEVPEVLDEEPAPVAAQRRDDGGYDLAPGSAPTAPS